MNNTIRRHGGNWPQVPVRGGAAIWPLLVEHRRSVDAAETTAPDPERSGGSDDVKVRAACRCSASPLEFPTRRDLEGPAGDEEELISSNTDRGSAGVVRCTALRALLRAGKFSNVKGLLIRSESWTGRGSALGPNRRFAAMQHDVGN
jgi:hypothetical protein